MSRMEDRIADWIGENTCDEDGDVWSPSGARGAAETLIRDVLLSPEDDEPDRDIEAFEGWGPGR